MKWINRKIFIFIIGILCVSIPVLLAVYLSTKQSLTETNKILLAFADDVMYRADKTGEQIENNIEKLKANNLQYPCLINFISIMRALAVSSSNIQAIGYIENNTLICSSLGIQQLDWNLGPVDLVTSTGTSIRFNVKIPNSEISFIVIEKNHYAAIIHKTLVLETAIFNKEISLGTFSLESQRAFSTRGFINTEWFKRLGNENQVTFLKNGYAVAIVK